MEFSVDKNNNMLYGLLWRIYIPSDRFPLSLVVIRLNDYLTDISTCTTIMTSNVKS